MWKRKPLPYVPVRDGASSEAIRAATIDVEQTKGPILPISVFDGRLSLTADPAEAVMTRRKAKPRYRFEHRKLRLPRELLKEVGFP